MENQPINVQYDEVIQYLVENTIRNNAKIYALSDVILSFAAVASPSQQDTVRDLLEKLFQQSVVEEYYAFQILNVDLASRIKKSLGL